MGLTFNLGRISPSVFTDSSLNVGIGAAPSGSYKLEVTGTGRYYANTTSIGNATGLKIEQAGTGDAVVSYLITGTREWLVGVDNSDSDTFKINNITGSADFTNIGLSLATTGAATFSGNIGINGVAASYPLYVRVGTNQRFRIVDGGSGYTQLASLDDAENTYTPLMLGNSWLSIASTGIAAFGNRVSVGNGLSTGYFSVTNATSGISASFSDNVNNTLQIFHSAAGARIDCNTNLIFATGATPTAALTLASNQAATFASNINYPTYSKISTDGYFGVGNSISGAFSQYDYIFLNNTAAAGGLFCLTKNGGGTMGGVYLYNAATSWAAYSDERLKNIKEEITGAIDILKQIRAVKYTWKSDTSETLNVGVIAQDIQKVLPEIIDVRNDEMKTLGVRHTELIPVLIAAIQELSQQNKELNERLNKAGL